MCRKCLLINRNKMLRNDIRKCFLCSKCYNNIFHKSQTALKERCDYYPKPTPKRFCVHAKSDKSE